MDGIRISRLHRYGLSGIIAELSRLGLAAVFLTAAVPKLLDWHGFAEATARYRLLPEILVSPFSLLLASLEFVLGLMLLMGIYRRTCAWLAILLNIMFLVAMGQALIRGIDTSCGCFGSVNGPLGTMDLIRDILFIIMGFLMLNGERRVE